MFFSRPKLKIPPKFTGKIAKQGTRQILSHRISNYHGQNLQCKAPYIRRLIIHYGYEQRLKNLHNVLKKNRCSKIMELRRHLI